MYVFPTKDTETSEIPRMCPGIGKLSPHSVLLSGFREKGFGSRCLRVTHVAHSGKSGREHDAGSPGFPSKSCSQIK